MIRLLFHFKDRTLPFEGSLSDCAIQIRNARMFSEFLSYEVMP